jgi:hypothetical protein
MTNQRSGPVTASKWFMPLFSLGLGAVILGASWIGGHPGLGVYGLAVMAGCGLLLLAGGRSETIRGLRGDGRDERFAQIDLRATAFSGLAVIVALIVAWLVRSRPGTAASLMTGCSRSPASRTCWRSCCCAGAADPGSEYTRVGDRLPGRLMLPPRQPAVAASAFPDRPSRAAPGCARSAPPAARQATCRAASGSSERSEWFRPEPR